MFTTVEDVNIDWKTVNYLRRKIVNWNHAPLINFPWRSEKSKFHGLIAEVLLQRTRAEQVIPVYQKFTRVFPGALELSKAPASKIRRLISPLGLSGRAAKLKNLGKCIKTNFNGTVPDNYRHLTELPGVGPYAASAFLSFHSGKKATIIDSNIIRFYSRFFGFRVYPDIRRNKFLIKLFERITPDKNIKRFNYSLLDLSRSICKPVPVCRICPVSQRCIFYNKKGPNQ